MSETPETPEPTESPEPEPTETGPTPPPRPAAMDDTGKKGAQAAAEYFISLLGYAFQSGESESIREMSLSATCISCENFAERADSHRDSDYVVVGGETTLSGLKVSDRDPLTGGFAVSGAFETSEMAVSTSDGENVGVSRSDDGFIQIDVLHDENTWRVMAVVTDQDSAE
ncbi:DUF6318 family protein [Paraoerskovia marina]|uniref:DUF6318 family protein n=1 Tax=Paraoerskovia marina TaxID=545619 RepID=UPI0012F7E6A2|nr:DUF6318 family protein [Paraoerskovia marina]